VLFWRRPAARAGGLGHRRWTAEIRASIGDGRGAEPVASVVNSGRPPGRTATRAGSSAGRRVCKARRYRSPLLCAARHAELPIVGPSISYSDARRLNPTLELTERTQRAVLPVVKAPEKPTADQAAAVENESTRSSRCQPPERASAPACRSAAAPVSRGRSTRTGCRLRSGASIYSAPHRPAWSCAPPGRDLWLPPRRTRPQAAAGCVPWCSTNALRVGLASRCCETRGLPGPRRTSRPPGRKQMPRGAQVLQPHVGLRGHRERRIHHHRIDDRLRRIAVVGVTARTWWCARVTAGPCPAIVAAHTAARTGLESTAVTVTTRVDAQDRRNQRPVPGRRLQHPRPAGSHRRIVVRPRATTRPRACPGSAQTRRAPQQQAAAVHCAAPRRPPPEWQRHGRPDRQLTAAEPRRPTLIRNKTTS